MGYRLTVIPGDGIGREISPLLIDFLEELSDLLGLGLEIEVHHAGDRCLEELGVALPEETVKAVASSDATLKGPVGETAMDVVVRLRQMFDLYANIRPAKSYPGVKCLRDDIDLVIVRENTEGLYKGLEFEGGDCAVGLRVMTKRACERIAEYAFGLAERRRGKVVAVHKANVLRKTCGLFSRVCREVASRHPGVEFGEMYVDAAAMNLIRQPQSFDVLLTTNMFGDILSDEASQLVGGLGMAPSANLGEGRAMFEPVHGSAPDIAGMGIANPFSTVLSAKLMFEWLYERKGDEACRTASELIESSVVDALTEGFKTPDLGGDKKTADVMSYLKDRVRHKV